MDEIPPDQTAPGAFKRALQGLHACSAGGLHAAGVVCVVHVDGIVLPRPYQPLVHFWASQQYSTPYHLSLRS